jgi:hypothetical protein
MSYTQMEQLVLKKEVTWLTYDKQKRVMILKYVTDIVALYSPRNKHDI